MPRPTPPAKPHLDPLLDAKAVAAVLGASVKPSVG
jgi:hypothetical protein